MASFFLPLTDQPDEARERDLSFWGSGWDACLAWLLPQLERANRDADFWYLRAHYSEPQIRDMQRRAMDVQAEAYWQEFIADPKEVSA